MKLSKSTYRALACTLLIIAGGLYYFNREELPPPPTQEAKPAEVSAAVTFSGSSIVEQQDGKKQWEVTAESVQMNPDTNKARLVNFKAILYRADGSKLDLVGRQAEIDTKTRDIDMAGDIKAVSSSDGAVFTSATARWAAKERKFYGGGGITLTRYDTIVTGDRIEGDEQLERVKVMGNARVLKGGTPQ
ncbi:LPS export ABC transporter periplasmic protein LptC [Anaeroselena agilis]|uniref:LPS export ABC transporter periplasmic protein LptC n=1 Tax=Anaeroselena agilis TaxID=3063788 RepID=A0ABU3P462_9FIRM|nr:LPS export ABC transporter periplasmic protein LptC [Selenomonadales bacterium 4137-cl]